MKHGHSPLLGKCSTTYVSWDAMLQRCTNPSNPNYPNYGGRGVSVCAAWRDFREFLACMGERPSGRSLDRFPDTEGNYKPGNVRWATRSEQQQNKRNNNRVRCFAGPNGEKTVMVWARISGRHYTTIIHALDRGWSPKEAVFGRLGAKKNGICYG
jgi:hypothetical protein